MLTEISVQEHNFPPNNSRKPQNTDPCSSLQWTEIPERSFWRGKWSEKTQLLKMKTKTISYSQNKRTASEK